LKMRDKNRYEVEYYKFFLKLRDIYLKHALYGTMNLRRAFHSLRHDHEREYHNADKNNSTIEEMIKNIANFELNNKVDKDDNSEFERKMEDLIQIISIEQEHLDKEINFKFREDI
jgi:hypothetical protein